MNTGTNSQGSRRTRVVEGLLLQVATAALVAACGGGGGYGGGGGGGSPAPSPAPAPTAVIRDAQFVDDTVEGLGFSVDAVGSGRTDSAGKFQFAEGKKINFFLGSNANHINIGSATPSYSTGVVSFSLQDLTEVQAANGDAYLSGVLRLLSLLDANDDPTDGFQVDAATLTAIDAAVVGAKTLDFANAATVENDASIKALATAKGRAL